MSLVEAELGTQNLIGLLPFHSLKVGQHLETPGKAPQLTLKTTKLQAPQPGLPGPPWKGCCDLTCLSLSSPTSPIGATLKCSTSKVSSFLLTPGLGSSCLSPSTLLSGQNSYWGIKGGCLEVVCQRWEAPLQVNAPHHCM